MPRVTVVAKGGLVIRRREGDCDRQKHDDPNRSVIPGTTGRRRKKGGGPLGPFRLAVELPSVKEPTPIGNLVPLTHFPVAVAWNLEKLCRTQAGADG